MQYLSMCILSANKIGLYFVLNLAELSLTIPMILKPFFFTLLSLVALNCRAQAKSVLLFTSGRELEVYQVDDSTYVPITYKYDSKFFKKERINSVAARKENTVYSLGFSSPKAQEIPIVLKEGSTLREDVFAITNADGTEHLYYYFDEIEGDGLALPQMRALVYGSRDARNAIRAKGWFYSGLVVGAATGYALQTSVFSLAVPPVFALGARIPTVRIKERYIQDLSYQYNEDYASGFGSFARSKRTVEALKGSAIGTLLGIVVYSVVSNND